MEQIERDHYRAMHIMDADPPFRVIRVTYQCPLCGITLGLKGHKINPSGVVEPEVLCPYCDFNDTIRLMGWKEATPIVQR